MEESEPLLSRLNRVRGPLDREAAALGACSKHLLRHSLGSLASRRCSCDVSWKATMSLGSRSVTESTPILYCGKVSGYAIHSRMVSHSSSGSSKSRSSSGETAMAGVSRSVDKEQ